MSNFSVIESKNPIMKLVTQAFKWNCCRNTERVMELFSEELKILDRNTVQLMIDEMQEEIDVQKETIIQKDQEIER